jgi:hypothetical protein
VIPGSLSLGPRQDEASISVRTYAVGGLPVESVVNFYQDRLSGWSLVTRQAIGDRVRITFANGRSGLEITAIPAPTVGTATGSSCGSDVQYTLLFGPLQDVNHGHRQHHGRCDHGHGWHAVRHDPSGDGAVPALSASLRRPQ